MKAGERGREREAKNERRTERVNAKKRKRKTVLNGVWYDIWYVKATEKRNGMKRHVEKEERELRIGGESSVFTNRETGYCSN